MNLELQSEVNRLGGDPSDPVWQWFLLNGPHGPDFTWGQTRSEPRGYVGLEHLQRIVAERETLDPTFPDQVRSVVARALASSEPIFLRRAIQVAAAVSGAADQRCVAPLTAHPEPSVAADARACLFVLRRRAVDNETKR